MPSLRYFAFLLSRLLSHLPLVVAVTTVLSDLCKGYVMDRTATLVVPTAPLIPTLAIEFGIVLVVEL